MELHRCRFVEYQPAAVNALDFTPSTVKNKRLAVGRANGDIEIWDPSDRYRFLKRIPGGQDLSVESVVWAHQTSVVNQSILDDPELAEQERTRLLAEPPRLFSSGLNPYIVEWDTVTLTAKQTMDSNGGAVWCLAVNSNGTRLAAGCEDGCIRLFDISDGQFEYLRKFEQQNERILSVAWGPKDEYIVSGGSTGAVRKWNVGTGRCTLRMTVDKVRKENTLVWSVVPLRDNVIVSGDSLGHVMFWDAERGTMKQSFNSHGADVLAVIGSEDGKTVYSAGVDCRVTVYNRVQNKEGSNNNSSSKKSMWVASASRRYHWHDIRALALDRSTNRVVSGGVDVGLIECAEEHFGSNSSPLRIPPFARKYIVSFSKSHKLIMAAYFNTLSLWRLGRAGPLDLSDSNAVAELLEPHQLVAELRLNPACNITSSALSENAQWIAVADVESARLFTMHQSDDGSGRLAIRKVRSFDKALAKHLASHNLAAGAHHVIFTPGCEKLILVTVESCILVIDMLHWETDTFNVTRQFDQHRGIGDDAQELPDSEPATVISIAVSPDGQWLATGDDKNRIHVFSLDGLQHHIELPRTSSPHTALSFNSLRPSELFIGMASNEFFIYDVEQKRQTRWSKTELDLSNSKLLNMEDRIRGVAYNPAEPDRLYVYGSTYICRVDQQPNVKKQLVKAEKRKHGDKEQDNKKQKKKNDTGGGTSTKITKAYEQILFCEFSEANTMVLVERPRVSILEKLPPSFYESRFGA